MKKSHEYDSPVLSKLVSIVTVFAICVCSICCMTTASKIASLSTGTVATGSNNGGNSGGNTQTSTGGNTQTSTGGNTQTSTGGDSTDAPSGGNSTDAPSGGNSTDAPSNGPSKEEVLKKYTEVMDNLKSKVATYEKKEFQYLSEDRDLGTIGNAVLSIAEGLMTSEDEADLQKRDDYAQIPVIRNTKGCILTDASAIKSATMTENGGKTTIVIVLNDEKGSLPAEENAASHKSTVGSMFNPIDQAGIDDIMSKFSGLATINEFSLTYKECTATLVFDTATGNVESLEQIMNVYISVDAKVVVVPLSGYATLVNTMRINNVAYK